jgi:hypothetical protein
MPRVKDYIRSFTLGYSYAGDERPDFRVVQGGTDSGAQRNQRRFAKNPASISIPFGTAPTERFTLHYEPVPPVPL